MKIRSTVFWPEKEANANDVLDLPDAEAQARIDEGFAVAHVEPEAEAEAEAGASTEPSAG